MRGKKINRWALVTEARVSRRYLALSKDSKANRLLCESFWDFFEGMSFIHKVFSEARILGALIEEFMKPDVELAAN